MRTLGLLGGMIWESTIIYYQQINHRVREQLGKLYSSKCIILGSTEIELLVSSTDSNLPIFDTTLIHTQAVADWVIELGQLPEAA